MKKRPVLILELLISLTLFVCIMGILFSSYKELSLSKADLRQEKETILSRQKIELRLSQIFSHIKELQYEGGSCVVTYDNGLDPDPNFRGLLEGMLYIENGALAFVTWPEKGIGRKEIICASATDFKLSFFDTELNRWSKEYPKEKPFMMKVNINDLILPLFL